MCNNSTPLGHADAIRHTGNCVHLTFSKANERPRQGTRVVTAEVMVRSDNACSRCANLQTLEIGRWAGDRRMHIVRCTSCGHISMRRAPHSLSSSESTRGHDAESGCEILLVDDDLPWLRTASDTLGRGGFHVIATLSAGAAVALLRRGLRPAIVVITARMASATADISTEIRLLSPTTDVMVLPVPHGSEATRSICAETVAHTFCGCTDPVSKTAA